MTKKTQGQWVYPSILAAIFACGLVMLTAALVRCENCDLFAWIIVAPLLFGTSVFTIFAMTLKASDE